jgi:hypothetical protein
MRFLIKLALASLMVAGAVAIAPTLPASAAPVHGARSATATAGPGGQEVAIAIKPGTRTVSESIPMTSRPFSRRAARGISDQPCITSSCPPVSVRVGKNDCGGFNGNIEWYDSTTPPQVVFIINVWGTIWDDCGAYTHPTTVYLYLSYDCFGCSHQNYSIASVNSPSTYNVSTGVNNTSGTPTGYAPSNVKMTACLSYPGGWGCGPSQSF